MKKIITFITIIALSISISHASDWKIRLVNNDYGYLEVQMKCINAGLTPSVGDLISGMTFQIYWPTSYGCDIDLICTSNAYNVTDANSTSPDPQTSGSNSFREYYLTSTPFACPTTWTTNIWETITSFKITEATGTGNFTIANNGELGAGLNWQFGDPAITYNPDVDGAVANYDYPTIVYDYVWTGATNTQWDNTGNWLTECGSAVSAAPNTGNNCIIPNGLANYPDEVNLAQFGGHQPTCSDLKIVSGASLTLDEKDVTTLDLTWIFANIIVDGTISSIPNTRLTVTGTTTINSASGIIVQADATGVGSFIDNGTITYGSIGTAKVQTYLTNSAGSGNFDIHLVGPTVDLISGGTNGALLSAFNLVNGNTYAYDWDETVGFASGWQNIYDNNYVVNTGDGIGLSTDDGSTNTLEMIGTLMTGNISSPSLTFSNNHNELISNPYPSAIDFDGLAGTDNSSLVYNRYWIWDPAINNYVANASPYSGDEQYIQVGQGFFVKTKQGGTFNFTNARRSHSNVSFRNTIENKLTVKVFGGIEGYEDKLSIRFNDEATSGYDIEIEAKKWESQNSDATQIKTIAEDNTELAINVLPTASLLNGMTSVPMHFTCGYNTEYTLSFYDMDSFETGTEIWLEDKQTGDDWISVDDNPDYTFTATPDDPEDRFVIHFFGTTGVDEFNVEPTVDIFSYHQNAFVRNNTNEVIKSVNIYTLAGKLLHTVEPANIKLSKVWVSDKVAYYVVRVITDKNVYTQKVFISK